MRQTEVLDLKNSNFFPLLTDKLPILNMVTFFTHGPRAIRLKVVVTPIWVNDSNASDKFDKLCVVQLLGGAALVATAPTTISDVEAFAQLDQILKVSQAPAFLQHAHGALSKTFLTV